MQKHSRLGTFLSVSLAVVLIVSVIPSSYAAETIKTFDGDDKIDVPNASKLQLAKFNVEVRFRIHETPTDRGFLVSKGSTENGNNLNDQNYALSVTTFRKVAGGFKAADDTYHYLTSSAVSLNTWHVAKLTYDGNSLRLFIDGTSVASKTVNKSADKGGTGPLRIGANANVAEDFFVGDMDYVKVVDRSTSTTVYSNTFAPPPSTNCSNTAVKNLKGVVFIDNTLGRHEDGGPSTLPPTPPSYVTDSLKYIKSNGFNAIRVPYYWEAYVYDSAAFMAEIDLIAKTAQANDICVIYSNFHYYTSSFWELDVEGKSSGRGFPSLVVSHYPVIDNDYIKTAGPFWTDFLNNNVVTGDGTKKVWDVQFSFLSTVINKVKGYSSTVGFEILNEPHLFSKDQYEKLGNYHTYLAKKIRSITDKKIFFDRETTRGFPRDSSLEYKIVPSGVSRLVYAPQLYAVPTTGSLGMKQIENFKQWSQQWGTEVLICEWGADSQEDVEAFLKAFKANGFGWTAYSWRNSGSSGLGVTLYQSDTFPPTEGLQILVAALNKIY